MFNDRNKRLVITFLALLNCGVYIYDIAHLGGLL